MARCPFATWDPSGTTPGGAIVPRIVIWHVADGFGRPHPHDGLEWHFWIGLDGQVWQHVDTNRSAAANYKANPFAISVETEGKAAGLWTPQQLDSEVRLAEWIMAEHPTVKRQITPTWDGSGFGYHVMFGAPGKWTPVAKSCPGPHRIEQFHDVLMPRILAGSPAPTPHPEDDDMPVILTFTDSSAYLLAGSSMSPILPSDLPVLRAKFDEVGGLTTKQRDKFLRDFPGGINFRDDVAKPDVARFVDAVTAAVKAAK